MLLQDAATAQVPPETGHSRTTGSEQVNAPSTEAPQETQQESEPIPGPVPSAWTGLQFHDVVCLEIFAGTARLSSALAAQGFQAVAVDNKPCATFRVLQTDLLSESGRALVLDLIQHRKVWYAHFAPPCSTASQARNIKLRQGPSPPPLRTWNQPDGVSGLGFQRVLAKIRIYISTLCRTHQFDKP